MSEQTTKSPPIYRKSEGLERKNKNTLKIHFSDPYAEKRHFQPEMNV